MHVTKGSSQKGKKNWAAEHMLRCACASEETAAVGRGQPGATRFPISLGREVAAPGRRNHSLAV